MLAFLALIFLSYAVPRTTAQNRSFIIDYNRNTFLKDGQPYRYISGSIHYFRIPKYYWADRLQKIQACGLNAVQFYIPWNIHEPNPDRFDFQNENDVVYFLALCKKYDLDAIVRIGPYTCGEFENGGLPWWLLKFYPDVKMRRADPRFLYRMSKWYAHLMPLLVPLLYKNGGPIISMQIENEYGSRVYCDREYTTYLRDLIRSYVGDNFLLFTVDGAGVDYLKCGTIPNVYPTVDFGCGGESGIKSAFAAQRAYAPNGPLVNSEFYPGWLDLWGLNHSTGDTGSILNSMEYMYKMGASFNFYMFEGGTNFGYMNGASSENEPVTTSYDYDAPLSEAGDPMPKFYAIKSKIEQLTGRVISNSTIPPSTTKSAFGKVPLSFLGDVNSLIQTLASKKVQSTYPKTFEELDYPYGFVIYETNIDFPCECNISVPGINDRGYVMINGQSIGTLVVRKVHSIMTRDKVAENSILRILVENNGRQCSGFNDPKGLNGNVTADGRVLTNWTMYPLTIENIFNADKNINLHPTAAKNFVPSIYYGKFPASRITDTFFDPTNWGKGQFFINGFNVGRYWPLLGPQVTLYVPKTVVKKLNYVVIFELEKAGNCRDDENFVCEIEFLDKAILNKTVIGPRKGRYVKKMLIDRNDV